MRTVIDPFRPKGKSTCTSWNPLLEAERHRWRWLEGLVGQVEEVILSRDPEHGDYTRLSRFHPGADTTPAERRCMTISSELACRQVVGRVIEQSPCINLHKRANLLHSRILEISQGQGLDQQAPEASFPEHGIRIHAKDRLVGTTQHTPIDFPFPRQQG